MIYKHILVAYDGSHLSKKALDHAVQIISERPVMRLTVLHVQQYPHMLTGVGYFSVPQTAEQEVNLYTDEILEEARTMVQDLPYASVEVRQGSPVDTILEYAQDRGCDLIVMGNRGLSGLKKFVLGSVSQGIVEKACVPVYIMKEKTHKAEEVR